MHVFHYFLWQHSSADTCQVQCSVQLLAVRCTDSGLLPFGKMVGTGIQQGGRADLIRCKMYVLPRNQLVITCPISPPFLFSMCLFLSNLPSSLSFLAFDLFSKHCKMACTVPLNMCCSKFYTVLKCSSPTTCTNSLLLQAEPHCRLQGALLLLPGRLSGCFPQKRFKQHDPSVQIMFVCLPLLFSLDLCVYGSLLLKA